MIWNPPFDASESQNLLRDALRLFKGYLSIDFATDRIKACRILRGTGNDIFQPAVIVKFFYFDEKKDTVFSDLWKLKKNRNELNGNFIYINEKLSKYEKKSKRRPKKRVHNIKKELFSICSCHKKKQYYRICCCDQYCSIIECTKSNKKRCKRKNERSITTTEKVYISPEAKKQNYHWRKSKKR